MGSIVNTTMSVLASAARTASVNSSDFRNRHHRGVRVHINATDSAATPSVVFTVQGKDSITGEYYTLLASAAVTGASDTYLLVYPGATAASNVAVNLALPPYWRVIATAGDADSLTYEVTAELLK